MQESLHFTDKGLKPLPKLLLLAALALALLIADTRFAAVNRVRAQVMTVVAPVQQWLQWPVTSVADGRVFLSRQRVLAADNKQYLEHNTLLTAQLAQTQTLARENRELKDLLKLAQNDLSFVAAAQVVAVGREPLSDRMTIDKGSHDGVQAGQAVVDAHGLIGQVTAAAPRSALVTLSTHQHNVMPVMVARTGFRTLLYGDAHRLDLRYFPADADLQVGDVLVTSGVDANFPPGIPVARVTQLETAAGTPYYRVQTQALGNADTARYVLVMPHNRVHDTTGLPEDKPAARKQP